MELQIYSYKDYKTWISERLEIRNEWGYQGKLAKAMGCQPAYLSRCLGGDTHLTIDQVLALAQYWSLTNSETDYALAMVEYARAATPSAQAFFKNKMKSLKLQSENLQSRFGREELTDIRLQSMYYSNWLWMAVHFATSVAELQTVKAMSSRFQVPESQVQSMLEHLAQWGLVEQRLEGSEKKWKFLTGEFHLSKGSPLLNAHHQNWRSKALVDNQNPESTGVHYSGIYTLSHTDAEKLKEKILSWIDESIKIVGPSTEEEVICFNVDYFKV